MYLRGCRDNLYKFRSAVDFLHTWVADKVTLYEYSTIQPCTNAAHVTTLSTGAGDIRRKQEAVRFGQQQPQRRSHSASEAYRDRGVM